tara:strand:- start:634 stop:1179 length:546 start_codon:yes stop_codon:yes gene_type:complete
MKAYLLLISTVWLLLTSGTQSKEQSEVILKHYIFEEVPAISRAMSVVSDSLRSHTDCSDLAVYSLLIHSFHYDDISFFVDPHYHHSIQKKRCYDLHNSIILTIGEHTFIATELTAIMLLLNNQELIKTCDYRYSLGWDDKDSCLKSNLYDFYLPALSNDSIEEFNFIVKKYPVWGRMVEIE